MTATQQLMQAKSRLVPLVRRLAHRSGAATLWALSQPAMRVIMLHGVGDEECPLAALEAQLRYLKRTFRIVPLDILLQRARQPDYLPRGEVALTFDDGLRNNLTKALPLLRALQAPATFYVCPGVMVRGCWIWTVEARVRLRWLSQGARQELAQHWGAPVSEAEQLQGWLKGLPNARRLHCCDDLWQASRDFVPTARQHEDYDPMTVDELRSLDPQLITVGAHSMTHPMLACCDAEEREFEIVECQRWLERELQRPVRHFCYPDARIDEDVVQRVARCYDSAPSCDGLVRPGQTDPHRLPRIPESPDMSYFVWRLHNPHA